MLGLAISCARPDRPVPPKTPEAAARLLLRLSIGAPRGTDWSVVAAKDAIVADPALFATTADALGGLGGRCEIVRVDPAGSVRRAVDLACALGGGGTASLTITTEEQADRTWRVVSVEGPGIGWPARRPAAGDGVTTSPPP
jgi:hypothetical protein